MWNVEGHKDYDWASLKVDLKKYGMRNSLLIAPMPTASTSQIMGNSEGMDPITANIYTRRVLAGEFVCINRYLIKDLIDLVPHPPPLLTYFLFPKGIWNTKLKNKLVAKDGSIQGISEIPLSIQRLYKTVWEISQKQILKLARSRAPYID